jgi:hypothetical protein
MNADESCHGDTEAMHILGGPENNASALNIRVYLRSSAADCFFQNRDYRFQAFEVAIGNRFIAGTEMCNG